MEGEVEFPLYMVCRYGVNRYGGRMGSQLFGNGVVNTNIMPNRVSSEYRRLFGIVSSYKLKNVVRAKIISQDPKFRLLLVLVALLVVDYCVAPHWKHASEPQRGGRRVFSEDMRLETLKRGLGAGVDFSLRAIYVAEGA